MIATLSTCLAKQERNASVKIIEHKMSTTAHCAFSSTQHHKLTWQQKPQLATKFTNGHKPASRVLPTENTLDKTDLASAPSGILWESSLSFKENTCLHLAHVNENIANPRANPCLLRHQTSCELRGLQHEKKRDPNRESSIDSTRVCLLCHQTFRDLRGLSQ